jgi:3-oxoacyl-[acyl-carrier protein] reductase
MDTPETQNVYPWREDFLEGFSFVVGGASSGLGRAVAEQLVAAGGRVLLIGRSADALEETARELGEGAFGCAADLATSDGAEAVVEEATRRFGTIDGVFVNAGEPPPSASVLELNDEQWRSAFDLLIGGPLRLLRGLLPITNDGGSILFVTGTSVRQPILGLAISNVLRPGVAALVKLLALELAPRIRINSLAPGRFETPYLRRLDRGWAEEGGITEEEQRRASSKRIPMGRYGDPQEFARVVTFLLSPAASYITGTSLQIDGCIVSAIP